MTQQSNVGTDQRYTNGRRCIICGGADRDPRGKGRRCFGFVSLDGKWAHCSREEHAGAIAMVENSATYAHMLTGQCDCGTVHGTDERDWRDIEAAYDYRDERGALLFQAVRLAGKNFRQRRPDGLGGWKWSLDGVRRVPYRLPELLKADPTAIVFVVEGEKDVETLRAGGAVATTNPMGAEKWHFIAEEAAKALHGRHVVVLPDADEPGRKHAAKVASTLAPTAASVRVLDLFPTETSKRDVSDWLAEGHTVGELQEICATVEPTSTTSNVPTQPDPWSDELAKALAEVKAKLTPTATQRTPLFGTDMVDLLGKTFDGPRWLVTGLVTRLGVAVIGGEPKSIKTWIALEFAIGVATGTKAFGEFFCEAGTALYFFAEDRDVQVRNRARALLAGSHRMPQRGRLYLEPRGTFIDVLNDEDVAWIIASARRRGKIDLIVLDPLRDVHGGEEDKSDSMRDVMRRLRVISDLLDCTVLVPHHSAKSNKDNAKRRPGQNLRGSSAIHGAIDAGLYIESNDDGDGVNTFANVATAQVKGGKSAGKFNVALTIEDDEIGEAVAATWAMDRETTEDKADSQDARDERAVLAFIRVLADRGEVLTKTGLSTHKGRPVSERRMTKTIDRLLEAGANRLIEIHQGRVQIAAVLGSKPQHSSAIQGVDLNA